MSLQSSHFKLSQVLSIKSGKMVGGWAGGLGVRLQRAYYNIIIAYVYSYLMKSVQSISLKTSLQKFSV